MASSSMHILLTYLHSSLPFLPSYYPSTCNVHPICLFLIPFLHSYYTHNSSYMYMYTCSLLFIKFLPLLPLPSMIYTLCQFHCMSLPPLSLHSSTPLLSAPSHSPLTPRALTPPFLSLSFLSSPFPSLLPHSLLVPYLTPRPPHP